MADLKFQVAPGVSGGLTFRLLGGGGEVLSAAGDFADREACLAAIREAVEALNEEQPFVTRNTPAGDVLELNTRDGRTLAHSQPMSAGDAAALRDGFSGAASEQEEYEIDLPPTTAARTQGVPAFPSSPRVISDEDYDFVQPSSSGAAGVDVFQNARDGRYYFHFNDAQGQALLYSRGFGDAAQRNKRLRAVLANGVTEQRYERREEEGRHFFILKGRNGQEIARSRAFLTLGALEASLAWLRLETAQQAEQYARPASARKGGGQRFNLGLASLAGVAGFELLKAADRRHYFLFNGEDGRPMLFSQGYKTSAGRDGGVQSLIRLGANPARYEAVQGEGGPAFTIRAGNRQEIARSADFASVEAATAAMSHLQARLPTWAAAFDVAAETLEPGAGEHLTIRREREEVVEAAAGLVGAGALAGAAPSPVRPVTKPETVAPSEGVAARPRRDTAAMIRRLWPVPVAALALACLAWGLGGHKPRAPAVPSRVTAVPASALVASAPARKPVPQNGLPNGPCAAVPRVTVLVASSRELRVSPPHHPRRKDVRRDQAALYRTYRGGS